MTEIVIPGQVLAQKYRLLRQLGQGGMGVVWEAEHLRLGSRVAIKLLDPTLSQQHADLTGRFLKEARAAATLQCPHVVRVFDHDTNEGRPFIVMEKLEGETLAERLDREGPLTAAQTFSIVEQLCTALTRAHSVGIVHRDIKPSNVFLTLGEGQREVVKVLDFGIAKHTSDARGTEPPTAYGVVMGTPWYMSPEQARGERPIDHSTDLWATGVLTFECLTGRRPFDHESFRNLVEAICQGPHPTAELQGLVSEDFDEWFRRATARDRAERFRNANELASTLRVALGLPPLSQRRAASGGARSLRPSPRTPRWVSTQRSPTPSFTTSSASDEDARGKRDSRKTVTIAALIGLLSCALSISLRPKSEGNEARARVEATVLAPTREAATATAVVQGSLGLPDLTQAGSLMSPNLVAAAPTLASVSTPRVTPASFDVEVPVAPSVTAMERPVHSPLRASTGVANTSRQKINKPAAAKKPAIDLGI